MHSYWRILLTCGLLALGVAGVACIPRAQSREPFLIAWNYDTSGYLETCGCSTRQLGGLARRATKLAELRTKQPVLALEGAHFIEDAGGFQLYKGETIIQALNLMHYDAVIFGVREAQQGQAGLATLAQAAKCPCICANLSINDQPWKTTLAMIDIAGSRVGITAVSQPEFASFKLPEEIMLTDPVAALNATLAQMHGQADFRVVCLEGDITWIDAMTAQFAGQADLFLSGNRQPGSADYEFHASPSQLNNWSLGRYLALVTVDPAGEVYTCSGTNLPLDDTLADAPEIDDLLKNVYRPQLKERFFSQFKHSLEQVYLPPEYCADCHKEQVDAYNKTRHAQALQTLSDAGQLYNPDCMKCHLVYDAGMDELHPMNCISCHSNITDQHVYDALAGKVAKPATPSTQYTREWCATCHDELNSLPFAEHWPQYVQHIYHGGDMAAAKQAAQQMGLKLDAPLPDSQAPAHEAAP